MAREQCHQALIKLQMYKDLGLGLHGKLVFLVTNAGTIGEHDIKGNQIRITNEFGEYIPKIDPNNGNILRNVLGEIVYQGQGEKITVQDTKRLLYLGEHRKISNWIPHPVYRDSILLPDPRELETNWEMKDYRKRFNRLRYYTVGQFIDFTKRDIKERTDFLKKLFEGQECETELNEVIHAWKKYRIPDPQTIEEYYQKYYSEF
jgi:hypothetical protein